MPFNGVMPAIKPKAASFGLLSVADVTEHSTADSHWASGYSYETELCNYDVDLIGICGPGNFSLVDTSGTARFRKNVPFGIKASDLCLTPGYDVMDRKQVLLDKLEFMTQFAIERELWNGHFAQSVDPAAESYLTSPTNLIKPLTSGAVSVGMGVAIIERILGERAFGAQGVIHAPRDVAVVMATTIAEEDGDSDVLRVKTTGTPIVSGTGYSGSAPSAVTRTNPLKPWIYATGPVAVHLGDAELVTPTLSDAVNARTNEMQWVAVRPAGVYFDGCARIGIQVDLTLGGTSMGDGVLAS